MKYLGQKLEVKDIEASGTDNIREDETKPIVIEVRTSDPISPEIGRIWFRSDL